MNHYTENRFILIKTHLVVVVELPTMVKVITFQNRIDNIYA